MAPTKKAKSKRRSARRKAARSPDAPSIDRELSVFAARVKSKERTISRMEGAAQRRAKALRASEERKRLIEAEREALRGTLDVLNGQRKAAVDERALAVRELKDAERVWASLRRRAQKSPALRTVRTVVTSVDARIDTLRKQVASLEKSIAASETSAAGARATLAAAEKERRDAQEAIQKLPNEIRAARGRVSRLLADLQSADPDDVQRFAATEREFRDAVDRLRTHARDNADTVLVRRLLDTKAYDKARERHESAQKKLTAAQAELVKVQADLQNQLQRRDNEIRTRVLKRKSANT